MTNQQEMKNYGRMSVKDAQNKINNYLAQISKGQKELKEENND